MGGGGVPFLRMGKETFRTNLLSRKLVTIEIQQKHE